MHLGVDTGYVIGADVEDVNGGEIASQAQGITVGNRLGYKWISDLGFTAQAQVGFEWLMVVSKEGSHGQVFNTDLYPVFNINTGWSF